MNGNKLLTGFLVLGMGLSLVACSSNEPETKVAEEKEEKKIEETKAIEEKEEKVKEEKKEEEKAKAAEEEKEIQSLFPKTPEQKQGISSRTSVLLYRPS